MTKRMGLMALGLSMVLLGGCSAVDDLVDEYADDKEEEYQEEYQEQQDELLNIPSLVTKNIVGTWDEGCENYGDGWSESSTLIFKVDGTGSSAGVEYDAPNCTGTEVGSWFDTFTYVVEEATTGADDEDAVELNVKILEDGNTENYYTMAHFYTVDKMGLAHNDDIEEENTPETRHNIFGVNNVMVRK